MKLVYVMVHVSFIKWATQWCGEEATLHYSLPPNRFRDKIDGTEENSHKFTLFLD